MHDLRRRCKHAYNNMLAHWSRLVSSDQGDTDNPRAPWDQHMSTREPPPVRDPDWVAAMLWLIVLSSIWRYGWLELESYQLDLAYYETANKIALNAKIAVMKMERPWHWVVVTVALGNLLNRRR